VADTATEPGRPDKLHEVDRKSAALEVAIDGRHFTSAGGERLHAVGRLHFSLPPRSFTCIVGPSGCGKTTTLRMILGLDTGYRGRVLMNERTRVGTVFQEPRLLPWRSVEQNVRLALPGGPGASMDDSLDALFAELGLSDHRDLFPGELSLGLARRVALARAFAQQPGLLVLDEPFVSLDETTAHRLRALLMRVWQARPTTALMVTHDLDEAVQLADRVLVFGPAPATVRAKIDLGMPRQRRDATWREAAVRRLRAAEKEVPGLA